MIRNKIYINGASYCNGFLLKDYKTDEIHQKSWVNLLSNDYDISHEIKNGKSFYDIYIESLLYLNSDPNYIYICVLPFNVEMRNNYYLKNLNDKYENVNINNYDHLSKIKNNYIISDDLIDYFYFKNKDDYFLNKFIKNLEFIFSFIHFLENKKIKHFIFLDFKKNYQRTYLNFYNKLEDKNKIYISYLFNEINNKTYGMMDEIESIYLNDTNKKINDLVVMKDNNFMTIHPSELAHQMFYLYIKNKIEDR